MDDVAWHVDANVAWHIITLFSSTTIGHFPWKNWTPHWMGQHPTINHQTLTISIGNQTLLQYGQPNHRSSAINNFCWIPNTFPIQSSQPLVVNDFGWWTNTSPIWSTRPWFIVRQRFPFSNSNTYKIFNQSVINLAHPSIFQIDFDKQSSPLRKPPN
jgi:hypothetical protein